MAVQGKHSSTTTPRGAGGLSNKRILAVALVLVAVALVCVFVYMACGMGTGEGGASQGSFTPQELSAADNEVDMEQGTQTMGADAQPGVQPGTDGQSAGTAASESSQGTTPGTQPSPVQQGDDAADAPTNDDGGPQDSTSGTMGEIWTDYY